MHELAWHNIIGSLIVDRSQKPRNSGLTMVIDTHKCVGCMDCVVACKTENGVPEGFNRDWITERLQGSFPTLAL